MGNKLDFDYKPAPELNICHKDSFSQIIKNSAHSINKETEQLTISNTIVPGEIWTVKKTLVPEDASNLITFAEGKGFQSAPITTSQGPILMSGIRNNMRCMIQDKKSADLIFSRLVNYIPRVLKGMVAYSINQRFRFYRYTPGQYFKEHIDGAFIRNSKDYSLITLQIYLNGDQEILSQDRKLYEGGGTIFFEDSRLPNGGKEYICKPEIGKAIMFKHRSWFHAGEEVKKGTKWVIRSDIMYTSVNGTEQMNKFVGIDCKVCNQKIKINEDNNMLECGCTYTESLI